MKNFKKIVSGLDTREIMTLLEKNGKWWEIEKGRQEYSGSSHKDTKTIFLRAPKELSKWTLQNDLCPVDYPLLLGEMREPVSRLVMETLKFLGVKAIGRVMLIKLLPGGYIDKHRDEGWYSENYERLHFVLKSEKGNMFYCGEERVWMREGECWWVDVGVEHWVENKSVEERVHLVVDYMDQMEYEVKREQIEGGE